jgi:MFS transporter, ACDE family, multidrug resistance protein
MAAAATTGAMTAEQRRLVPLVFAVTLTSVTGNALLSPAIPDILDDFGRSKSSTGVLVAALPLPGIVIAPLIGILADRFGRRNLLIPCLALFGTGGIAVVTAPSFEVLVASRFVMGLGSGGLVNLAVVLLGDAFTGEQRTAWIGRNSGVLTIALAGFPVMSGFLTSAYGWRWALAPYSIALVTAVATFFLLDNTHRPTGATVRQQLGGIGLALRSPRIVTIVLGGGMSFAVIFGVFLAAYPNHLDSEFGLGADSRGLMIGLPAITSSVAAFNLRRVRLRFGPVTVLAACSVVWIVSFVAIGLAGTIWLLVLGSLLYGFGEGALIPTLQDAALHEAPDDHRGAVLAVWTGCARLGQTTGPLASAIVLTHAGSHWSLLGGAIGGVALLAMFALGPLRRRASVR